MPNLEIEDNCTYCCPAHGITLTNKFLICKTIIKISPQKWNVKSTTALHSFSKGHLNWGRGYISFKGVGHYCFQCSGFCFVSLESDFFKGINWQIHYLLWFEMNALGCSWATHVPLLWTYLRDTSMLIRTLFRIIEPHHSHGKTPTSWAFYTVKNSQRLKYWARRPAWNFYGWS